MRKLKDISKLKIVSVRAVNVDSQEQADEMFQRINRITGSNLTPTKPPVFNPTKDK